MLSDAQRGKNDRTFRRRNAGKKGKTLWENTEKAP